MTGAQLIDAMQRGEKVYCSKCSAELISALDDETMAKLKVHRGIYCPKDPEHVSVVVDVRLEPEFWDQFDKENPAQSD